MRKIIICGLDECGRGAWAGPLVAAGVVLSESANQLTNKLKDSKKLNERQRKNIYKLILKHAKVVEVEIISTLQINNQGIGWANKEIFRRLIRKIEAHKYIVDGNLKFGRIKNKRDKVKSMVKADSIIAEVMAASIVAKVTRDKLMHELHMKYPRYGWISNVGYGTKYHLEAVIKHGRNRYHRGIFVTTALKNLRSNFSA
jgi:ribonuclease HII